MNLTAVLHNSGFGMSCRYKFLCGSGDMDWLLCTLSSLPTNSVWVKCSMFHCKGRLRPLVSMWLAIQVVNTLQTPLQCVLYQKTSLRYRLFRHGCSGDLLSTTMLTCCAPRVRLRLLRMSTLKLIEPTVCGKWGRLQSFRFAWCSVIKSSCLLLGW